MRALVVGLGSMGKRRVRCLAALGVQSIGGFDVREDRRHEAHRRYEIPTFDTFEHALNQFAPTALVISTGPAQHMHYANAGVARGLHCFIEASVVDAAGITALADRVDGTSIIVAPSCTMAYFPGPKRVAELVRSGEIGRPLNLNYQTGQYLPDWHPWEDIADYYVSQRDTGGCREIVPFELTWLNALFGDPAAIACVRAKLSDMNADIDDVYHCLLRYPDNVLASITVEVLSRPRATRELRILGSDGEIVYSADENAVRHIRVGDGDWTRYSLAAGTVESGYINPEEPYIEEIAAFRAAVERGDPSRFPNSLRRDARILQVLQDLESVSRDAQ